MYQSFYNLKTKPFQTTTDPKFLWLGEKHSEALATLKYGILENKGFLLLTGDVGTGKTALINRLVRMIDVAAIVATIPDPNLDTLDFFNFLAEEFKMNRKFDSKGAFLIQLKHFLQNAYASQKKVLLIIDEAQRLNHELLEEIRLLSNIELDNKKLINIFFVGQSEFNDTLMEEKNKAVRQRITVTYHIYPLSEKETRQYINHRLKVAGSTREIFTRNAIRDIFNFASGCPRLINIICDHALLTGYAAELRTIDSDVIKQCEKELRISKKTDIKTSDPPIIVGEKEPAESEISEKGQPSVKRAGFVLLLLLLLGFAGYLLYDLQLDDSPRWKMEEIAPQKYELPAFTETEELDENPADEPETNASQETEKPSPDNSTLAKKIPEPAANETDAQPSVQSTDLQTQSSESPNVQSIMPFPERTILIYFKRNSNELPEQAYETLDRIAEFMTHKPEAKLNIKGYSDSTGSYSYNISISGFRANTIKTYLVGKGVNPANISAVGLGPQNPIASNATPEGREKNRRVEIELDVNE